MFEAHEIHPDQEIDWTIPKNGGWAEEFRLRQHRNNLIKFQLQAGMSVQYRSSGWSLFPQVHSNDLCMFEPVLHPDTIEVGEIVFCEVQPGNRFYAHKVRKIYFHNSIRYFDIGNNHDPPGLTGGARTTTSTGDLSRWSANRSAVSARTSNSHNECMCTYHTAVSARR